MRVYTDQDADLSVLEGRQIAAIGYGNQGRSQAVNLSDSVPNVIVGDRENAYADRVRRDGFTVLPIEAAADGSDIVMMLIPEEVAPGVF